jgi:hypothetical protein
VVDISDGRLYANTGISAASQTTDGGGGVAVAAVAAVMSTASPTLWSLAMDLFVLCAMQALQNKAHILMYSGRGMGGGWGSCKWLRRMASAKIVPEYGLSQNGCDRFAAGRGF